MVWVKDSSIQLPGVKLRGLHIGPCGQRQRPLSLLPVSSARAERTLASFSLGVGERGSERMDLGTSRERLKKAGSCGKG